MKFFILSLLVSSSVFATDCHKWVGSVASPLLNEISGITFSKLHKKVLYAHNDSGDKPRLFAMRPNGKHISEISIKGAKHIDWEDMTTVECPSKLGGDCLALGDIGNNKYKRKTLTVYFVREPKKMVANSKVELKVLKKIEFGLDTAEQNFEGMFSYKGEIYLISKMDGNAGQRYPGEEGKSIIYHLDQALGLAKTIGRLDLLATKEFYSTNEQGQVKRNVPNYFSWATGAELDPSGRNLFILTYGVLFEYELGPGGILNPDFKNYKVHKFPALPQVEAVALRKGTPYIVSEYQHQPIYKLGCDLHDQTTK